jgi:hypothetical protein
LAGGKNVARLIKSRLGDDTDACEKEHQQCAKRKVDVEKQQGLNFCDSPRKLRGIYLLKRLSQDEYKAAMPSVKKQDVVCNISTAPLAKRGSNFYKTAC